MVEYVKICPRCGAANPEGAANCPCGFFLGLVSAQAVVAPEPTEVAGDPPPAKAPAPEGRLRLECPVTGKIFEVKPGDTVGQAHPTSRAEVRISGVPNLNFVSRHHCRFVLENGAWFVESLASSLNGTSVNDLGLAPGGRARVRDGDEIRLANAPFKVTLS